jgi:hypothetical protein
VLFPEDFDFEVVYALLPWIRMVVARKAEELPLLCEDGTGSDLRNVGLDDII